VYAALRALGAVRGWPRWWSAAAALARRFAAQLDAADGVTVLNDVVLNQVLVRFDGPDSRTRAVLDGVRRDGTCFMSGTTWRGRAAIAKSPVTNWSTDEADVDTSSPRDPESRRGVTAGRFPATILQLWCQDSP
jgi:glutamate/tyrosine decarboxylase-like PLP-dependent enzyme